MKKIMLLLILLLWSGFVVLAQDNNEESVCVDLVFIGNSITQGALLENPRKEAPPVQAAIFLKKKLINSTIRFSNNGVSGCTTVDYLPETETLFSGMQQIADQFSDESWASLVFSIMLGTNDSASEGTNGAPVSSAQYKTNMKRLIDRLLALYPSCKIVLHRPVWYSENTFNYARYLAEGLKRLEEYYPILKEIVKEYSTRFPGQVFMGDTEGFDYFRQSHTVSMHPEKGNAGTFYLHPNKLGARVLGELWGKSILKVISVNE